MWQCLYIHTDKIPHSDDWEGSLCSPITKIPYDALFCRFLLELNPYQDYSVSYVIHHSSMTLCAKYNVSQTLELLTFSFQ